MLCTFPMAATLGGSGTLTTSRATCARLCSPRVGARRGKRAAEGNCAEHGTEPSKGGEAACLALAEKAGGHATSARGAAAPAKARAA